MRLLAALLIGAGAGLQVWGVLLVVAEVHGIRERIGALGRDATPFPFTVRADLAIGGAGPRSDDHTLTKKLRAEWQDNIRQAHASAIHEVKEVASLVLALNDDAGQQRTMRGVKLIVGGLAANALGSIWSIWVT
jgi:hypothetical protein